MAALGLFGASVLLGLGSEAVGASQDTGSPLVISEFMALNVSQHFDEDGDASDWVEILNRSDSPIDLEGWSLTDRADNLRKWLFPIMALEPGEFLVVFASGENQRDPTRELHTNFRLSGAGEYLALVGPTPFPNGSTIAHAFDPAYPEQSSDVAYGLIFGSELLVNAHTEFAFQIPRNGDLGMAWTGEDFIAGPDWSTATVGLGFNLADALETAGELIVDLDARELPPGPLHPGFPI